MSKARELADLLESDGDVKSSALDNAPSQQADWNTMLNKPSLATSATTDTTNANNITQNTNMSRLGSGSAHSGTYLRGDGYWASACTNWPNCSTNNCVNCACVCNC